MIRRILCTGALAATLTVASVPAAHAATASSAWASKFCAALQKWQ
jgi:hypothetical protein